MELKVTGKIVQLMQARSGTSQRGDWKSQQFLLETHEQYPRKIVFDVFGADRLAKFNLQEGMECDVYFDIDAKEYNDRWYNSVRAYDVRGIGANMSIPVTVHNADGTTETQGMPFPQSEASQDGLGF